MKINWKKLSSAIVLIVLGYAGGNLALVAAGAGDLVESTRINQGSAITVEQ